MSEHLSPLDATFLELEQLDPGAHMHIGALLVLDSDPERGVPALADVRTRLAERLEGVPAFRERLSTPGVGGRRWPAWELDPTFEIAEHVRRAALPPPGGARELFDWAGQWWSSRLDRSRPLWEMALVEGLEGGRWGLAVKMHHCLVDGVGSLDVGRLLLDTEQDPGPWIPPHRAPRAVPSRIGVRGRLVRAARAGIGTALHPGRAAELLDRSRALAELVIRNELIAAPRSSINVPISGHRRFDAGELRLDDARAVKLEFGGTVNDVVLAATCGGLRALLCSRGDELPEAGLRTMVPVDVRDAADELALGNRISSLFVRLPVSEPDPLMRYRLTVAETKAHKRRGEAGGGTALLDLVGMLPPAIHSLLARTLYATRLFNLTVTNVPGPQLPLYALGGRLRAVYPLVPLPADHAVGIAAVSYNGRIFLGLNADEHTMPDLPVLRDGILESFDELVRLATGRRGPRQRRRQDAWRSPV